MHCQNMAICAWKKTKLKGWGSVSIEANGCAHFTFHRHSVKAKSRPHVRNTKEYVHLSLLYHSQRLGEKLCPCQIKSHSRKGCI